MGFGFGNAPTFFAAFTAGILSFLTPCVLPLVPGYISFISGVSLADLEKKSESRGMKKMLPVIVATLLFIIGFSLVFILSGLTAFALGQTIQKYKEYLTQAAGVIIIILGLHMAGAFRIRALDTEKRFQGGKGGSPVRAFLLGMAFAFGWSPCLGPILGSIIGLAMNQDTAYQAMGLMAAYSLGLAIPFFLTGLAVDSFFSLFDKIKVHFRKIEIGAGVFLVLIGLIMVFNQFGILKRLFILIMPDAVNLWG